MDSKRYKEHINKMSQTVEPELLEKIKKLFALASGNPNENEAMVASQMAMKLLAKHNLSMEAFNGLTVDAENRIDQETISGRWEQWKSTLLTMCAYNCFCLAFTDVMPDKKKRSVIVGTPTNRMAASHLFRYLESVIPIITENEMKRINPSCGVGTAEIWKQSFRKGLLIRLRERMEEQRQETVEENKTIVRYDMYAQANTKNREYLSSNGVDLTLDKNKSKYDNNSAKQAGYNAGSSVSLNPSWELPTR